MKVAVEENAGEGKTFGGRDEALGLEGMGVDDAGGGEASIAEIDMAVLQ